MYKIRSRIINFRVTNEEFERLKSASALHGARCLSDFARSIILEGAAASPNSVNDRLLSCERRLSTLETSHARFEEAVAGLKGNNIEPQG